MEPFDVRRPTALCEEPMPTNCRAKEERITLLVFWLRTALERIQKLEMLDFDTDLLADDEKNSADV